VFCRQLRSVGRLELVAGGNGGKRTELVAIAGSWWQETGAVAGAVDCRLGSGHCRQLVLVEAVLCVVSPPSGQPR
jgi:hypothetical protein